MRTPQYQCYARSTYTQCWSKTIEDMRANVPRCAQAIEHGFHFDGCQWERQHLQLPPVRWLPVWVEVQDCRHHTTVQVPIGIEVVGEASSPATIELDLDRPPWQLRLSFLSLIHI